MFAFVWVVLWYCLDWSLEINYEETKTLFRDIRLEFYFADDAPEKKEVTLEFFNEVKRGEYDIYISDVVFDEIERASEEEKRLLSNLISEFSPEILLINEEIVRLAKKYIAEMALPKRAGDDSKHTAVATFYEMDALVSWNLKHLANLKRKQKINRI